VRALAHNAARVRRGVPRQLLQERRLKADRPYPWIVIKRDGSHITASLAANRGTAQRRRAMLVSGRSTVCGLLLRLLNRAVSCELDVRST
jgi:hypothetical protein